ncbi:MAG: 1-deoxy-D-xylulose-5-phosphate synthase [Clostridiales bacterium]|nr:1-deoxy-D-xylulose-5-phosphate synthase [Clostridiales bacterium]
MLEKIKSPEDIKELSYKELDELAGEIRIKILDTVSQNGGHLASNLGMVEATLALHKVFNMPSDKIIFDVSHQCYTHKLLTGRYDSFHTLRSYGGISGFTNRAESEYDILNEGHSGSSISAALGIAMANKLQDKTDFAVAVVGDGSLTNGLIFEAINNCGDKNTRLIILVNDNEMSISRNIGGLPHHLSKVRTSKRYFTFKHRLEKFLTHIPLIGRGLASLTRKFKNFVKRMLGKNTMFDDFGLSYLGPVDGHNIKSLVTVLEEAKTKGNCCVVHMATHKGKGYLPAEVDPDKYHSVGAFNLEEGSGVSKYSFSDKAGELVCARAESDPRLCAITAAMCSGTGLTEFSRRYPERFFDVGIAEEHAVTFSGGLSVNGLKPVLILYSSFAQRTYDQLIHDISIQNLSMVLMLDRCGLVAGDGITHQGIFDIPAFTTIPNIKIYSPSTYSELENCFNRACEDTNLSVVRYPKGGECNYESERFIGDADISYTDNIDSAEIVIITYGRLTKLALDAAKVQSSDTAVVKLIKVFPIDYEKILTLIKNAKLVYFLEEGYYNGGIAEKIAARLGGELKIKIYTHAITSFVEHGSLEDLYKSCGFTVETITENIRSISDNGKTQL